MKKIVSMLALAAFLFSVNAHATEPVKEKKKKAKTEKSVKATTSTEEKKECATEKKAGCCSSKKAEEKKS